LTDDPGWGLKLNRKGLELNRVSPAAKRQGE